MKDKKEPMINTMDCLNTHSDNTCAKPVNQEKTPLQLFLFNANDILLPKPKDKKNV